MQDFEMSPPSPRDAADTDPDYADTDDDGDTAEDEAVAAKPAPPAKPGRTREGLPSAYRMRHARHYVEQLMGDAPIQTVRQVAIDQIDRIGEGQSADDLTNLAASIGQVGMLQPLLVVQADDSRFQLVAGEKRLLAARSAGLDAVPCLVVQADEARAAELRDQATVRSVPFEPVPAEPEVEVQPDDMPPLDAALTAAFAEIRGELDFVAALMPAAAAARSSFQQQIVADLASVEQRRAATLTAAVSLLADSTDLQPEEFEWVPLADELRAHVEVEARLRGVEIEWLQALRLRTAVADRRAVGTAWTCILHAALGIARQGDRITLSLATPRVRPAIILTVSLHSDARFTPALPEQSSANAFAGTPGEVMLGSARRSAQRQGGRLTITTAAESVTIEFVVPQPLAYWQ